LGGERGMVRSERLFLTQNTLPLFDRLLDILDGIPGEIRSRVVSPFFYAGLANRYEDERITEDIRDDLPERINRIRPARLDQWLSEREWIPIMLETASQPRKLLLKLDVDETNIDRLENASCEEIFAERERCETMSAVNRGAMRCSGVSAISELSYPRSGGSAMIARRAQCSIRGRDCASVSEP
jgi:hypothetical protein